MRDRRGDREGGDQRIDVHLLRDLRPPGIIEPTKETGSINFGVAAQSGRWVDGSYISIVIHHVPGREDTTSDGDTERHRRKLLMTLFAVVLATVILLAILAAVRLPAPPVPNRSPIASFSVMPTSGDTATPFTFDASSSSDPEDAAPALQVRWDWAADGAWDSEWSVDKVTTHVFSAAGTHAVGLEVRDTRGLSNTTTRVVVVSPRDNVAPTVAIFSPREGALLGVPNVTVNGTADDDVAISLVEVSLDGSAWSVATGTSSWSAEVQLSNGSNTIRAQATDSSGNTGYDITIVTLDPDAEFRLGVVLSLTGALQALGEPAERAIRMAVEEINAQGGVFGRHINVSVEDDQTNPSEATNAAARLITWEADAIVGSLASSSCLSIVSVAKANGVFEISGACPSPFLSDPAITEGWLARTHPSDALQGVVGAYHAYGVRGFRSVAVIALNNPFGHGVAEVFAENFTRHGGAISTLRYVPEYATDYTSDLSAVMATSPEAIYLAAYPWDAGTILRNWYANATWRSVAWLFSDGVLVQQFIDDLITSGIPPDVVQTFQGTTTGAYLNQWGPRHATWSAAYEARWGVPPAIFDGSFYDAVYVVALAAEASSVDSGAGVRSKVWAAAGPPGSDIGPGQWSAARQVLAAGGDVDYNGSANFVDPLPTGDVTAIMVIWGIDTANLIVVNVVHDEPAVRAMLP